MIMSSDVVSQSPSAYHTEIEGEAILLNLENVRCFAMDGSANQIWHRLETPKSVSALCAELLEDFESDPDVLERDVLDWLSELEESGLIVVVH